MRKKIKITPKLKDQCRSGNITALREYLDTTYNNNLIDLRNETEDFRYRQGYLQALEDIAGLVNNQ